MTADIRHWKSKNPFLFFAPSAWICWLSSCSTVQNRMHTQKLEDYFKRCSSNPSNVFHPELPVILASSRHPSSERKQRMRHSKQPTTSYTFTWQNASDFLFFNFGKSNKLVLIGVNCSLNVLHEQTHADNVLQFHRQIMSFIHFSEAFKEPHVQLRVNKSGAQLLL